jgi:acyl-CoA thioester hydrolase
MGIVYHAHYLVWCEAGRTELMRQAGCPYTRLEERGFALAVAHATLRFHASARYDDVVVVETVVKSVASRGVCFEYLVLNEATRQKLVTASTTLICLDRTGAVVALPPEVRSILAGHCRRPG